MSKLVNAAKAGGKVVHIGCVGSDGRWLSEVLAAAGVDTSGVRVSAEAVSGHAVIQVNERGENAIVIIGGANRDIGRADIQAALGHLEADDWLLLQNEINNLPMILEAAREAGARVAFNVAPVDGREQDYDLCNVSLLIINEIEAHALANVEQPDMALDHLCHLLPECDVVLTLGRDGLIYGRGDLRLRKPAFAVDAVDETAAGDAFIGYLMASLIKGDAIESALVRGSAAGALAVTVPGAATSIPSPDEVTELCRR
jgi:ribokinase